MGGLVVINWSLLQPVDYGANVLRGYQIGEGLVRKHKFQSALAAYSQNPDDPNAQNALASASPEFAMRLPEMRLRQQKATQEQQDRQRAVALGQLAINDPLGAQEEALGAGDFDLADKFAKLSADQKKQALDEFKFLAPFAYEAKKLPPEQRQAYVQSLAPQLATMGWDANELAGLDLSDDGLNRFITMGSTLEQAMARDEVTYKEVGPGARLVPFDSRGRPLAGTGAPEPVDNPSVVPAFDMGDAKAIGGRFGQATSTFRTPADNKRVGGVANSYHLKGRAIDIARAPGVSHAQIEQAYRNAGYNLVESLDEGDHSHFAFSAPAADQRANTETIRRQAKEAIAAGADPEAVRARAAGMGVKL